ncbi:Rgp1-domain-containing protein [Mortierella sp. GBAus27b]|nr:hypothetical protein BGX31_002211 [Mortierella sp. GBA43]KAI8361290.1 Rgp1-domain-containing protein [Mortierella sp. GBAus27b]
MPISVKATFAQEGVFFAGEKLNCTITFTNPASSTSLSSPANGQHPAMQPPRPSVSLQSKLQSHPEQQDSRESNDLGNGHRVPPSSNTPANTGMNHDKPSALLSTSPSAASVSNPPSSHPTGSSNQDAVSNSGNVENGTRTRPRPNVPQQRPDTTISRALSQTRLSSDITRISTASHEHSERDEKDQNVTDQGQDDQEEQEQTVAAPPRSDANTPVRSPPGSPSPRLNQQPQQQDESQTTMSSPGLLGLASYMYRSASFSSLASAFGLSGSESEPMQDTNEKKLPPLPPPGYEDEKQMMESADQSARMGTSLGLERIATDVSTNGLNERMIELQVTDNADGQSIIDEGEYQTPRPSMDYSTRSSMQSVRGPFQSHFSGTPRRRSSLMSNFSTSSGSRHLVSYGSKKEALVWGSVQVIGQFMVDGSFIRQQGFEPLKTRTMYRPTGSGGGGSIGGGTLGTTTTTDWRDRANANRLFPVFSTPPSILFVDLQLAPGESTSYTYQIELPQDLPPSHRGKTIRFAYHLVLGVQRGSVHTPAKSVQLPFRLYNNISEQGVRPVYDLMSPVILHKDTAISGVLGQERSQKPTQSPNLARKQFEDYVDELMKNIRPNSEDFSPAQARELTRRESDAYKDEETLQAHTCLEKVSLLSRTSSAGSYDICKNNVPVAKLSLIKTRFKLGETVHGIISFAAREIPTYQISVTLETMETIDANYACRTPAQNAKLTKRIHAELHESCIDTKRTSFALCIPPTATPEFTTSTLTLKWYIRVEFITGTANQPRFKMTSVDERRSQHQAVESLSTESFDCMVPIQVYPTSYETGTLFPPTISFSI